MGGPKPCCPSFYLGIRCVPGSTSTRGCLGRAMGHSTLDIEPQCFSSDCPSRALFDQIADKWSMMVLAVLDDGPHRFNAIKRRLEGVTQKALTQCLRRMERNGLISRAVISLSP